jgi:hypothetical protein
VIGAGVSERPFNSCLTNHQPSAPPLGNKTRRLGSTALHDGVKTAVNRQQVVRLGWADESVFFSWPPRTN